MTHTPTPEPSREIPLTERCPLCRRWECRCATDGSLSGQAPPSEPDGNRRLVHAADCTWKPDNLSDEPFPGCCGVPSQADALAWVAARWPEYVTVEWRAMKVGEEAGEVLGAVIKASLGLKPRSEIGVEAAQTLMCLLALAEAEGFDLRAELAAEWERCATRTWPSVDGAA